MAAEVLGWRVVMVIARVMYYFKIAKKLGQMKQSTKRLEEIDDLSQHS